MCVAQKAVSKVEGRSVPLESVEASARAREIAADEADPRMIELILRESVRIVRRRGAFLICETRHGFVCAAAGVDRSNAGGGDVAVLLPLDPDASARRLRDALAATAEVGVIVTDSFGRPFRLGTTGRRGGLRRARARPHPHGRDATTPGASCRAPSCTSPTRSPRPPSSCSARSAAFPRRSSAAWPTSAPMPAHSAGLMPLERDLFRNEGDSGRG